MNTWDFQLADGGEVVVQLPGGLRFAGDLPHGHGAEAAAQRQAHGGLHNPFPLIPL